MGNSFANGLGTVLLAMGLLVSLPVLGGGGLHKAVANYLYPPLVNSLSEHTQCTSSGPVVSPEPVNLPSATPVVNDTGKGGLKITALPNELVVNILANLPIRDLLVCKHVCTNWQTLVTTVPALAIAAYRGCHPAGYVPKLNDAIKSYRGSLRQWLNSFNEQGSQAVTRLDGLLASGGPHFPEQLFFTIASVLDETPAFDCRKVCTIEHPNSIYSTRLSPDQQHLVTCSAHTIKICRFVDGCWRDVDTLGQSDRVLSVYFSPDSQHFIAVLDNDKAKIWQLTDGQWQQQADLPPISVLSHPCFNADTTYLVTVSRDDNAQIYGLVDGHWQPQATALDHYLACGTRFHPKEPNILATYGHDTVTLWYLFAGQWQQDCTLMHTFVVSNIQFSPDGERLMAYSGGSDRPSSGANKVSIQVWRRIGREWRPEAVLPGSTAYFSPSGNHIISTPSQMRMQIWRVSGGRWNNIKTKTSPLENCFIASFSPNECNVAIQGWMDSATVWRDRDGLLAQEAVIPCLPLPRISFSPHGTHLLAAADMETVSIWGIVDGRWQVKATLFHDDALHTICFSPQGSYVLTTTWDGTVNIWTLNSQ